MSQAVIGWLIAIVVFIVAEAATVAHWLRQFSARDSAYSWRYFSSFRRRCLRSRARRLEKSGQKSRSV